MAEDFPLARSELMQEHALGSTNAPDSPMQPNPLLTVWHALKGRLRYAIPLGLLLAAAGGFVGYRATKPMYESTGLVRIKPYVDGPFDKLEVLPMFDAYLESQALLMRNRRTTQMALGSADWRPYQGQVSVDEFEKGLLITRPKSSEIIIVAYTDSDADRSLNGVSAVLDAYRKLYDETDASNANGRLKALEAYRDTLSFQLSEKENAKQAIQKQFGTINFVRKYDWQADEANKIRGELNGVILQIDYAEVAQRVHPSSTQPATSSVAGEISDEAIMAVDAATRSHVERQRMLEQDAQKWEARLGPNHQSVKDKKAAAAQEAQEIARSIALYRQAVKEGLARGPLQANGTALTQLSLPELKERKARLEARLKEAEDIALQWGQWSSRVDQINAEVDVIRGKLQDTKSKLEKMNLETGVSGRLQITPPSRPTEPTKDKRLQFSAAGAAGGFSMGMGVFVVLGLLDRRFRSVSDATSRLRGTPTLLGILPHVPEDLSDPDQAALAAHCVHHIRTLLQLRTAGAGPQVYAITSPSAGDGKTSLTLAMGLSFAASGSKTLLMDCDIIGRGLSIRTNTIVRRRIGQVLLREGLLTQEQLHKALEVANRSGRRLGQVVVNLGYASQEAIDQALGMQGESMVGLTDVLAGEPLEECIQQAGVEGLWVMPIGSADAQAATRVSPSALQRAIDAARASFDVILVDTGPILGSLEAAVAARAADQTVLAISRGEQRPLAEKAIDHLSSIGAVLAGLVFNRAHHEDVMTRYSSSVSVLASSPPERQVARPGPQRLGPVASAVAGKGKQS